MSTFLGVLQRLSIVEQTQNRLVLRELPLLDWGAAFVLVIGALILSIVGFWISTGVAAGVACYFILQGRVRFIYFDALENGMAIVYQTPFSKNITGEMSLSEIRRAYLFKGDDDGSQVVLVLMDGEELGISVYSRDMNAWKEEIVIAINAILHEAHKQKDDTSETESV